MQISGNNCIIYMIRQTLSISYKPSDSLTHEVEICVDSKEDKKSAKYV